MGHGNGARDRLLADKWPIICPLWANYWSILQLRRLEPVRADRPPSTSESAHQLRGAVADGIGVRILSACEWETSDAGGCA
jgi:hypothetical protein